MQPKPIVLAAGGPGRKIVTPDPVLQAALAVSGVAAPSVAYVGAASGDHRGFFGMISGMLQAAGAGAVTFVATAAPQADPARARAAIEAADVVFVSGGDVEEGMRVLAHRGLVADLRRLHRAGKCFVGLSAGSIMLARQWVRWTDPDDDSTAEPFDCLDIAPVLCDMHGEGEQWGELQALLRSLHARKAVVGYGVRAGGGLRVLPNGTVAALGERVNRFACVRGEVRPLPDLVPE